MKWLPALMIAGTAILAFSWTMRTADHESERAKAMNAEIARLEKAYGEASNRREALTTWGNRLLDLKRHHQPVSIYVRDSMERWRQAYIENYPGKPTPNPIPR